LIDWMNRRAASVLGFTSVCTIIRQRLADSAINSHCTASVTDGPSPAKAIRFGRSNTSSFICSWRSRPRQPKRRCQLMPGPVTFSLSVRVTSAPRRIAARSQ